MFPSTTISPWRFLSSPRMLGLAAAYRTTLPDALEIESTVTTVPYPRVEGYVKNRSLYNLQNVRLHVAVLDDGGKTVGEAAGWVFGNVFSGGRTYFVIAIPRTGASYRVTVTSYDIAARGH